MHCQSTPVVSSVTIAGEGGEMGLAQQWLDAHPMSRHSGGSSVHPSLQHSPLGPQKPVVQLPPRLLHWW